MKAYFHCSYSASPVGYVPGGVTLDPDRTQDYELQPCVPEFLKRCFGQGMVRKGFGRLPGTEDTWFLLVKKLESAGQSGGEETEYYISFAFTTADWSEYQSWFCPTDRSAGELADAFRDAMRLDRQSAYGYTLRPGALHALARTSFRPLMAEGEALWETAGPEAICLEMASARTEPRQLEEAVCLPTDGLTAERPGPDSRWVRYSKKKRALTAWIWAAVCVSLALMIACFFCGRQADGGNRRPAGARDTLSAPLPARMRLITPLPVQTRPVQAFRAAIGAPSMMQAACAR